MHRRLRPALLPLAASAVVALLGVGAARAQTPPTDAARDALPGKAVFEEHCATCHLHPELTHAVPVAELHTFPAERINTALSTGVMRAQGASLSDEERDQVVAYLAAPAGAPTATSTTSTSTTVTSHTSTTGPAPKG